MNEERFVRRGQQDCTKRGDYWYRWSRGRWHVHAKWEKEYENNTRCTNSNNSQPELQRVQRGYAKNLLEMHNKSAEVEKMYVSHEKCPVY